MARCSVHITHPGVDMDERGPSRPLGLDPQSEAHMLALTAKSPCENTHCPCALQLSTAVLPEEWQGWHHGASLQ